MPLFPLLDLENLVQEGDKTRLDVSKSFASGTSAITTLTVKPGKSASAIDVLADGHLDYCFDFTIEVDASNNQLPFTEDGAPLVATVPNKEYTPAALAAAMQTALNAVGSGAYTAAIDSKNRITLTSGNGTVFGISSVTLPTHSAWAQAGFGPFLANPPSKLSPVQGSDWTGKAAYTGYPIEQVEKKITLSVNNSDSVLTAKSISRTLLVVSKIADNLFSNDDMLRKHESDIMKYVADGRATFLDIHRRAQTLILEWLDAQGYVDDFGYKILLKRLLIIEEFREWSAMLTLRLIFEGMVVSDDDVFSKKAVGYESREAFYRNRAVLRIDLNEDGEVDLGEQLDTRSGIVVRR